MNISWADGEGGTREGYPRLPSCFPSEGFRLAPLCLGGALSSYSIQGFFVSAHRFLGHQ